MTGFPRAAARVLRREVLSRRAAQTGEDARVLRAAMASEDRGSGRQREGLGGMGGNPRRSRSAVGRVAANEASLSATHNVVRVSLKGLDGHAINLRLGTTDGEGVVATFEGRFHRPPDALRSVAVIWDLGANIGLTMADFAVRYPVAEIFGVELAQDNLALAEKNLERWADRCHLLHAAVWPDDGLVAVTSTANADGNRVATDGDQTVTALSPATLLERSGPPDFVKMDVEGAERELLGDANSWAAQVRCINVECHGDYTIRACASALRALGFATHELPRRPWRRGRPAVLGLRPGLVRFASRE